MIYEDTDGLRPVDDPNEGLPYYNLILSIDEIRELLRSNKDDSDEDETPDLVLEQDKQTGLYYLELDPMRYYSVLHWQLITELLIEKVEQVDWCRTTCFYSPKLLQRFFDAFNTPLIWGETLPEIQEKYIVVGRIAMRSPEVTRLTGKVLLYFAFKFAEDKFLWFADTLPTMENSFYAATPGKALPDMIIWEYLATNEYANTDEDDPEAEEPWRYFNPGALVSHIQFIAERRGGKRAAEIIRLFREDWQDIKIHKCFHIDELTKEQVSEFEQCLFAGMDRNLRKWETEQTKSEQPNAEKPDGSFFAVSEMMTFEMCEKELMRVINRAKNKAAACREILRAETVGYFVLSDKTDQEKADAINPWVAFTNKKYMFTGDDFRKARNS